MDNAKYKLQNILSKFMKPPNIDITKQTNTEEETITEEEKSVSDIIPLETIDSKIYHKMFIHELRTPLSTISMGIDILGKRKKVDPAVINDIKQSLVFIEQIFTNFAVIHDGHIELNLFEPFSIVYLFEKVKFLLQYNLIDANVLLEHKIQPDVYNWVFGDRYNLKHCIINLLKNAIKYRELSRKSIISIHVSIASAKENTLTPHPPPPLSSKSSRSLRQHKKRQTVVISITDNNNHILPHIKKHLFETFNSTSGSGLGLYICKSIIELHGGTISHDFLQPYGNEFRITLPLELCEDYVLQEYFTVKSYYSNYISENSGKNTSDADNDIILDNSDHSENIKLVVLLVDDSKLNRKMLRGVLKKSPIFQNIYDAEGGEDMVKQWETFKDNTNIVFLDKHMPCMDGPSVAKYLRSQSYNQLIIGVTGDDDHIEKTKFLQNGADYIFIKPLNNDKIQMIKNFVKKYGTERRENKNMQVINNMLEWV